jgi:putative ABC transport system ATP-binding protein
MAPLVELAGVSKVYEEGGQSRSVLRDIRFDIGPGEFVAIRGRSGSGKTTLLNLIAGLDRPTAGQVVVDGRDLAAATARERTLFRRDHIGFVFQFFNLIPTLTVLENAVLPAELGGNGAAEAQARARRRLGEVGLLERANEFPDRLSGGEQQRVAIARALVRDPRLVLADEPTGNLDDATGRTVLDLLDAATRGAGKALVLVTHSDAVARRADRVLAIEDGRLIPAAA